MKVTDKKCSDPAIDVDVSSRNQQVVSVDQINIGVAGLVSQG